MNENILYRLLEHPFLYKISQFILGPGAEKKLQQQIGQLIGQCPPGNRVLDVGCGPSSWLFSTNIKPVGLDISWNYAAAFSSGGRQCVVGSATHLPFPDEYFDSVWCIGLLHHLSDGQARQTITEMHRVCRPGGYIIIQDAVLPENVRRRLIAALIRRLDRGRNMRNQEQIAALLPDGGKWHIRRYTYTLNGLEMLECSIQKHIDGSQ